MKTCIFEDIFKLLNMKKRYLLLLMGLSLYINGIAQTTFDSPGQQTCNTTNSKLAAVTAVDGVTITPYRWVTRPCIDENFVTLSINDCSQFPYPFLYPPCSTNGAYLRKPTFCYNNSWFPTSSGYPLAIAQNLTANSGNCIYGAAHVVADFTSVAKRPKGLKFTINDIDNPYDSIQVLVYSSSNLASYVFTYQDADITSSFVKNSLNTLATGSGDNVSFVSSGWYSARGWNEPIPANVDQNNAKGAIDFVVDPSVYVDSVVIRHIHKDNRPDANPAFSIGAFEWTSNISLPVTFGTINAHISENNLKVLWTTLTETDNDYFNILISKDGSNYSNIGKVLTKAPTGNSSTPLDYTFTTPLNNTLLLSGILIAVFGILLFVNRKNKFIGIFLIFISSFVFAASCTSSTKNDINFNKTTKLFLKIIQVNKDGKEVPSKVVTVQQID